MKPAAFALASFLVGAVALHASESDLALARQNLDALRGMSLPKGPASKAQIDALNKKMDAAWGFFNAHKDTLPVAEDALKKEVLAKAPDQFFLLDVGHLLLTDEADQTAELAVSALERIDPKAEIIRANWEELFHFAMKLGATGKVTARHLAQLDRIYLPNETAVNFFRAPHMVNLTPDDVRGMVYGVVGEPAAPHLVGLLGAAGADRKKVLMILHTVGSERNTPDVKAVMDGARDYETLWACIYFLRQVGGPSGRAAVLALDPKNLDEKARAYLQEVRPEVEEISFASLVADLSELDPGPATDQQLQRLLDKSEANNGADEETPPGALAKSGLPKDRLLAQIKRIRAVSFRRENNHVFEDLLGSNTLINALQFK